MRICCPAKLEAARDWFAPRTLVYSHYVDGMFPPARHFLEKVLGLRVGLYTGVDKSGLDDFLKGRVDVLLASSPVGTGLDEPPDGLPSPGHAEPALDQRRIRADHWTASASGRCGFDQVEIVVPEVVLEYQGQTWSWDQGRMAVIRYKRTLSDCALDGVVPETVRISPSALLQQSREALDRWIARLREDGLVTLYREARATWPEHPVERLAEQLRRRPEWVVGDFGCGECLLKAAVPNRVVGFDHVAWDDPVIAGDMAVTPLEPGSLDVAVFSLSLMGTNWPDYLREAYRTLKRLRPSSHRRAGRSVAGRPQCLADRRRDGGLSRRRGDRAAVCRVVLGGPPTLARKCQRLHIPDWLHDRVHTGVHRLGPVADGADLGSRTDAESTPSVGTGSRTGRARPMTRRPLRQFAPPAPRMICHTGDDLARRVRRGSHRGRDTLYEFDLTAAASPAWRAAFLRPPPPSSPLTARPRWAASRCTGARCISAPRLGTGATGCVGSTSGSLTLIQSWRSNVPPPGRQHAPHEDANERRISVDPPAPTTL